jgi:hypothetical protein
VFDNYVYKGLFAVFAITIHASTSITRKLTKISINSANPILLISTIKTIIFATFALLSFAQVIVLPTPTPTPKILDDFDDDGWTPVPTSGFMAGNR